MIVCPKAPPLTVEDYRSLPEAGPRYQLIEGDLYMAPAPNRFHQEISRNLQVKLFLYLRETCANLRVPPRPPREAFSSATSPDCVLRACISRRAGIYSGERGLV
jgi:Uma2 family endonuclease